MGTGKDLINIDLKSKRATTDFIMHLLDITKSRFFR